jgi:Fe2+ or Zn2+ uptake regulation protein
MTTLDVCIKLYEWFEENDHFDVGKNFKNIFLISEDEDLDKATLTAALKKLESQNVITRANVNGKSFYILNRKLASIDQEVTINCSTAIKVAKVINEFCDSINDHKDVSDPSEIKGKDILHLALILEAWQQNKIKSID